MSWINLKELEYPVMDNQGECVALFKYEEQRTAFMEAYNSTVLENNQLEACDYLDVDTDITIRAS